MIPIETIKDWVKNKKRIQDRLNRIKKRLKKFEKQKVHFEMRLRVIQSHEKEARQKEASSPEKDSTTSGSSDKLSDTSI